MSTPRPRRGDVWLADLDKRRPVVIVTRDPVASVLDSVIAVPVTTRVRGLSTEVPIGREEGVRRASVGKVDGMTHVRRTALVHRIGRATPATMSALCDAAATAIGCGG